MKEVLGIKKEGKEYTLGSMNKFVTKNLNSSQDIDKFYKHPFKKIRIKNNKNDEIRHISTDKNRMCRTCYDSFIEKVLNK